MTEIEDINSPKIQTEMQVLVTLNKRVASIRLLTVIGAPLTSFWLLYIVYRSAGFLTAFVWFIGLSIAYKFGPSPMLALRPALSLSGMGSLVFGYP